MGPRKLFRLERKRGEESLSLSPKIFPDRSGKLFLFPNPENYENRNWREIQEFREGGDGKEARDFIVRETERVNRNRSKPASTKESQILKSVWTSRHSRNNGVFTSSRKYTRGFLLSPTIDRSLPLPPPPHLPRCASTRSSLAVKPSWKRKEFGGRITRINGYDR